jgi:hypothetical protein
MTNQGSSAKISPTLQTGIPLPHRAKRGRRNVPRQRRRVLIGGSRKWMHSPSTSRNTERTGTKFQPQSAPRLLSRFEITTRWLTKGAELLFKTCGFTGIQQNCRQCRRETFCHTNTRSPSQSSHETSCSFGNVDASSHPRVATLTADRDKA